jgi:hypothetical protein
MPTDVASSYMQSISAAGLPSSSGMLPTSFYPAVSTHASGVTPRSNGTSAGNADADADADAVSHVHVTGSPDHH